MKNFTLVVALAAALVLFSVQVWAGTPISDDSSVPNVQTSQPAPPDQSGTTDYSNDQSVASSLREIPGTITEIPGPQGPQGDAGQPGPQGWTGDRGPRGYHGRRGYRGLQGPMGPQGLQGPVGPQGPAGQVVVVNPGLSRPNGGGTPTPAQPEEKSMEWGWVLVLCVALVVATLIAGWFWGHGVNRLGLVNQNAAPGGGSDPHQGLGQGVGRFERITTAHQNTERFESADVLIEQARSAAEVAHSRAIESAARRVERQAVVAGLQTPVLVMAGPVVVNR